MADGVVRNQGGGAPGVRQVVSTAAPVDPLMSPAYLSLSRESVAMTTRWLDSRRTGRATRSMEDFQNLNQLLEISVTRWGQRPLFGFRHRGGWTWITYAGFADLVARCRAGLARHGLQRGDRIGIVSDNCVEWAATCYAASSLGAALVPMYAAQTADEWEFIIRDSGARLVIAGTTSIARALQERRGVLPGLEHLVSLVDAPGTEVSWASLVESSAARVPIVEVGPSDMAAIIYTSGTMGVPKGVVLSQRNLAYSASASRSIFSVTEADRSLSFLPWAHAYGQTSELHTLLCAGCSIAINDELGRLIPNLAAVQPTVLIAVPRIFNRIYEGVRKQIQGRPRPIRALFQGGLGAHARRSRGESLSVLERATLALANRVVFEKVRQKFGGRLRFAVCGSAALNPEVGSFISALGIAVHEGYGLTEASPTVAANTPGAHKAGTVGRVLPGVTVEVDLSKGTTQGEGEIIVRGPIVMQGYYGKPEETREVLSPDGALHTGDLGFIDPDGFLHVTGRLKEQYKLENGKYVAPAPLEEQLKEVPLVLHAMLHGANRRHNVLLLVVDPEKTRAWAEQNGIATDSDLLSHPELKQYLGDHVKRIATTFKSYERPKGLLIVDDDVSVRSGLLTPTLKLRRHAMLERYEARLQTLYESS